MEVWACFNQAPSHCVFQFLRAPLQPTQLPAILGVPGRELT